MTMESKLVNAIGEPAMLEQTAEECAELSFACLKLARMLRGENKVHGRTEQELRNNLEEEIADLHVCFEEMFKSSIADRICVSKIINYKMKRMKKRLDAANTDCSFYNEGCNIEECKICPYGTISRLVHERMNNNG